jgi:hypothetical protein
LCYADFDKYIEILEENGGQGGGYSWESMVKAVAELRNIEFGDVEFDPEGDMFCAISEHEASLAIVASIIKELGADKSLMIKAIATAQDGDYFE